MRKSDAEPGSSIDAVLSADTATIVPGIVDAATARIVELQNCPLALISGSMTALSLLALPDDGRLKARHLVEHVHRISSSCSLGLIVDIDNGYGNVEQCAALARALTEAGAAAVIIEDTPPSAHSTDVNSFRFGGLEAKIRACKDVFGKSGPRLFARTNARAEHSVDECAERLSSYADAGADGIFLFNPVSPVELLEVYRTVGLPQIAVIPENTGESPDLGPIFKQSRVKVALAPRAGYRAALAAFDATLQQLVAHPFHVSKGLRLISTARMRQIYRSP